MSYSKFTNLEIKDKFGVEQVYRKGLFAKIPPRPAGKLLEMTLAQNLTFAMAQGTEKARSEFIIAPVFAELRQQADEQISVFSGIEFNVDKKLGLSGFCDFLVSRSPYQSALEVPVVVAIEAKREDFELGINQCLAEMIAARIYNEKRGKPIERIYGCVTIGNVWQFLALQGKLAEIDSTSLDIGEDLERILGILWAMTFDEIKRS